MSKTVPKQAIVVAADHRGKKIHGAVIGYLRAQGRQVIPLVHTDEDDSYADIAREACAQVERGLADSAILIDQFGSAVASVANMFMGAVAMTASSPYMAREITRKCNPNVLCIPSEDKDGAELPPEEAVAIVSEWLQTEFLDGIPESERDKYEGRDEENRRIHLGIIDGLLMSHRRLSRRQTDNSSSLRPALDMLEHYDSQFEE